MSEHERALLLSLHPRFAESILRGTKSVEIRRKRPSAKPGTLVIIYATIPTGAVIGTARVVDTHTGDPCEVWSQHHADIDLSREEFYGYLSGASKASALVLSDVERLERPVSLAELRATVPFHPPQGYRYLTPDTLRQILNGSPEAPNILARMSASGRTAGVSDAYLISESDVHSKTPIRPAWLLDK
ncbi:ASCH domain-containing protein [Actinoallomurus sp. CA-142502]|uniref:ASCH domain-containing protein n=1 Tax=Actinoallomurus sp. CA-142502 TaxID=3239885 RepID=UPI003D8F2FF9